MFLVLWFGWPMGSPDGEENVRRGRHHRDLRPLVRRPLEERVGRVARVDRKTVRKYPAPAEAAGISPGGPPMSEADWSKLIKEWFPGLIDRRLRQVTWPEIDRHRDYIESLLGTVTVSTIHQRPRHRRRGAHGRCRSRHGPALGRGQGSRLQLSGVRERHIDVSELVVDPDPVQHALRR
jgi:hypothetical protein